MPKVGTANGLQAMIENYINWDGNRATRINVMGRNIKKSQKTEFGGTIETNHYITSNTRKGTADISATINGKSAMFEVKIGRDRPSDDQLKEQAKERAAGGIYEFIHDPEEFFILYDKIKNM